MLVAMRSLSLLGSLEHMAIKVGKQKDDLNKKYEKNKNSFKQTTKPCSFCKISGHLESKCWFNPQNPQNPENKLNENKNSDKKQSILRNNNFGKAVRMTNNVKFHETLNVEITDKKI